MKKKLLYSGIIIVLILLSLFFYNTNLKEEKSNEPEFVLSEEFEINKNLNELSAIKTNVKIQTSKDGTKFTLDPDKIMDGGPGKGGIGIDKGIPALDERNIKFVSVEEADKWIQDNELVLALIHKGIKKVYPLQIMVWHEIANDVVAGDPIAVTYCPLCGSGIAYYRVIDDVIVKFGTSGKLYNSNLIMYDDKTQTYWQQIDGNAIIGELTGYELQELSIDTVVWRDWKTNHPDSEVLSQDTGMFRSYGRDPYGSYYEDSFLIYPVDEEDNRIHPKTVVFGIEINNAFKAYKEDDLKNNPIINDKVGGVEIEITRDNAGTIKIKNLETNEEIVKERDFWFAWYAFHPDTKLYEL